jgi:hypothetical protein
MQARKQRTSNELRCFCARQPLLATYGLDEHGCLYVHVKVFKQQRIFGEVLVTEGTVKLHCRECLRWHKVVMRVPGRAELEETEARPVVSEV